MLRQLPLLALCSALAAQTAVPTHSPTRFVPADSFLVMRVAAPSVWQQRFAKTQMAKLLHASALAPLVDQASAAIDEGIDTIKQHGKIDASLIEKLLSDYRGELTFSLQVDWDKIAESLQNGEDPPISMVMALSPDGSYDLTALASGLDKLIEEQAANREPIRDLVVGDHHLRLGGGSDFQTTLPAMIDGSLVVLAGANLDERAARLLAEKDRFEGLDSTAPLLVHANLDNFVTKLVALANDLGAADQVPFDLEQVTLDLGLQSLSGMDVTIDAVDKFVAVDTRMNLNDKERGLFGMVPITQGRPKLLRWVPPAADQFSVSALDLGALYATVAKVWNGLGDSVPMTFDDAQQAFAQGLKVRLKEDLLDYVGTELLMLQDIEAAVAEAADGGDEDPTKAFSGTCLGLSLRNGKAFAASLETALRARGMHASRKSEDYAGTTVYALKLAGLVDVEYAVTDDLLLVSIGKSEVLRRHLRAVLDARSAKADSEALPAALQSHLGQLPDGWNGVGAANMAAVLRGYHQMFTALSSVSEVPEEMVEAFDVLAKVGGDLQRLNMQSVVNTSYVTARQIAWRLRW